MCSPFCSPFKEAEKAVKAATNALRDYRNSQQEQHLTTAIIHYHHAYETSNEKHNQYPDIIINYTALLNKQDRLSGGNYNLEQVIQLLEEARMVMENRPSPTEKYGVLLNILGQVYLDRYRISKTSEALASATKMFEQARSQNRSSPVSLDYASSLIGSASVIRTACELQPPAATDVEQLNAAITLLKTAQVQSDVEIQEECCRHLASVYDLLHKRTRNPRDLDFSIDYHTRILYMLHPQSLNRAPALLDLAKRHLERHTLPNAHPDLVAAQRYRDEAQNLVGQGPEAEELEKKIGVLTRKMEKLKSSGDALASRQGQMLPLPADSFSQPGTLQIDWNRSSEQVFLPSHQKPQTGTTEVE